MVCYFTIRRRHTFTSHSNGIHNTVRNEFNHFSFFIYREKKIINKRLFNSVLLTCLLNIIRTHVKLRNENTDETENPATKKSSKYKYK